MTTVQSNIPLAAALALALVWAAPIRAASSTLGSNAVRPGTGVPAAAEIRFNAEKHDRWTARTVQNNNYTVEAVSQDGSSVTTFQTRRAEVSGVELDRSGPDVTLFASLRSYESEQNGKRRLDPALEGLVGEKVGVWLSSDGHFAKDFGLVSARHQLAKQRGPWVDAGKSLLQDGISPTDLQVAWEDSGGRYLGRILEAGHILFFPERFAVPLAGRIVPYFSAQTVIGPVVVKGRKAVRLSVRYFSLVDVVGAVSSGFSPAEWTQFTTWAKRSTPLLSTPDGRVDGSGTLTVPIDGTGVLEESVQLHVRVLGATAAAVGASAGPRIRSIDIRSSTQLDVLGPETPNHGQPLRRRQRRSPK